MNIRIASFRRSRHRQNTRQAIVFADSVHNRKDTEKFIGKTIIWQTPGKEKKVLKGKITAPHGGNGGMRTLFEKGLPGQALGQKATIE